MNAANIAGNPQLIPVLLSPEAGGVTEPPPQTTWLPGDLFPGMTSDAISFTIPLTALSGHELTAADVDPQTGDARQLMASICGRAYEWYIDLATKPQALEATRNVLPQRSGSFVGSDRVMHRFAVYVRYPARIMTEEPPTEET